MKKKLLSVICAAIAFLMTSVLPALAIENNMTFVEELNLNIPSPENWYVFTRNTPEDDPVFNAWEDVDKEYIDQLFEQNTIYYNAVEPDSASQEIVITMVENTDVFDWNGLSDSDYKEFANEIINADMEKITGISGVEYGGYKMVDHPQCKLMKLDARIVNEDEQTAFIQYVTIVNGQHINITLRSYTGAFSAADEKMFDQLVQEMRFTKVEQAPFNLLSLLKSENIMLIFCVAGGAILIVAAVVVICVVVGSNKRKKCKLNQINREQHPLYGVQPQQSEKDNQDSAEH